MPAPGRYALVISALLVAATALTAPVAQAANRLLN